jgi:hypothetical protein
MKDEQLNNDIQVIENLLTDFKVNSFDRQFTDISKSAKNFVIRNFGINAETTERGYLIVTDGYKIDDLRTVKKECENFILNSNDEVLNTGYKAILQNINEILKEHYLKRNDTGIVTFEQLFNKPENANLSLDKLKEIFPNLLSDDYSYIRGTKGIFPMFINVLQTKKYIKNLSDMTYRNVLNDKIKNLNLSKDASEFRKNYRSLNEMKTDLVVSLSQLSH